MTIPEVQGSIQVPVVNQPQAEKISPAVTVLLQAQKLVKDVIDKNTQSMDLLQQNINTVTKQRIGLEAQLSMLQELVTKIKQEESK